MTNELDNLKRAWQTISEAESKKDYSTDDLKRIVKKKSNNELVKIRRKIIFEWSMAIVLSVFLVLFIHFINPADTNYALLFIGVILAISFFPYLSILQLKFSNTTHLKDYLIDFIARFDKLVKQYIRMATILIPVAGLGGFLLGFHSAAGQDEWDGFFTILNLFLVVFFVGLVSLGGCWVQRRYFKWIYGKNIQRLRDCLTELEDVKESE